MVIEYQLSGIGKVAKKIVRLIKAGDLICLQGELAAGKTTLVKAIAKEMGYRGLVNSPTFVIEHRYPVKYRSITEIVHLDFYRLSAQDLEKFDWQEYLGQIDKVIFVEWPERATNFLPPEQKIITIDLIDEKTRRLTLSNHFGN